MRKVGGTLLIVTAGLAVPLACREPTQMTIDVGLFGDLPCSDVQAVGIIARKDRDTAERALQNQAYTTEIANPSCADGHIGTLVITPDQNAGAVIVAARVIGTGLCAAPDYKGCIIARRAFQFIDHKPLFLPVTLEARCVDVPCDAASSCRATQCTASDVSCADDGTCTSAAEPQSAPGGGSVLPDGGVITTPPPPLGDAAVDSGDGSSDAQTDVTADGPKDGPHQGVGTNLCPTPPTATDCSLQGAQGCCDGPALPYECTSAGACRGSGYYFYSCNGRAHCPGTQVCCANNMPASAVIRSRCEDDCPESIGAILCTTNDDCPPLLACNAVYIPNDGALPGRPLSACGVP